MSKNHPNDNIYSILGKLDALKPTAEEKHQSLIKEIRDSVEAKGSITEGVSSVEATLTEKYMGFKKLEKSIAAKGDVRDPAAVAAAIGRKKYGQKAMTAKAVAGKKKANEGEYMGRPAKYGVVVVGHNDGKPVKTFDNEADAKAYANKGIRVDGKLLQGSVRTMVDEVTPPGEKAERMVKHIKQGYAKDGKLTDKEKAIAYATTWAAHNKGQVEEGCTCNEGACAMHEADLEEAEITRTAGKTVHRKTEFPGYPADDSDDLDNLRGPGAGKRGRPRKHAVVAPKLSATGEKLGRGRPVKAKAPTFSKQADPFGRVSGTVPKGKKGTVHSMAESMDLLSQQLNTMLSESRLMDDAGETLQHILNRFRAEVRNFEQGGDLDKDLYDALYDYYVECGEMPYGVQKARDEDPMRWVAEHLEAELGDIAYGKDPANAEHAGLEMEAGIPGNVPAEQIPGKEDLLKGKGRSYYEEEVTMEDELNELARLAGISTTEGNAFTGKLANTPKGGEFELDGKTFKDTSALGETEVDEDDMEEGNAFSGAVAKAKADGIQPGEKVEVGGKTYPVKEGMEIPGQDDSEFNVSTSMSSDGDKNVTVTATGEHAASLLQMLRIAGLGNGQAAQDLEQQEPEIAVIGDIEEPGCEVEVEEEGIEVDQPAVAPQNAPNETYGTIKQITSQGDDLNRQKKQDPQTANKAANPMTNAQQVLKSVAQLESKLAEEYESIKKVSK